jgi:hypothetical protein
MSVNALTLQSKSSDKIITETMRLQIIDAYIKIKIQNDLVFSLGPKP